ncbi:MAG: ABC transporter ATP-binding protein, partial [Planctomycetota bacterium]|nr:ABC transporter ATP-binding protein [Planctomycetota bacterium]
MPAIEVVNLSKCFGAVKVLERVAFDVAAGEMFFLLGPSGCGKTTLLRILAGLETPDEGTVRFRGQEVTHLPPHLRGAPMVFQNYALWPHLSVADNVAFGLVEMAVPAAEIAARVREALAMVGLAGYGDRRPAQLSGGQQQRVALARALVMRPAVILLDEPLSNLDAKLRAEMREEISRLHRQTGLTFVYVTHDQVEALSLADRLAVLRDGRLLALGSPADLYHRPPNLFCAEFLGDANRLRGRVMRCEGEEAWLETPAGVWRGRCWGRRPQPGEEAYAVVRPENLALAEGEGENSLCGRVERLSVNGAIVVAHLACGAQALRAVLLNHCDLAIRVGEMRRWQAAPSATGILAE